MQQQQKSAEADNVARRVYIKFGFSNTAVAILLFHFVSLEFMQITHSD